MECKLSKTQQVALEMLKSGANCFIDRLAGTGKTFLFITLNIIVKNVDSYIRKKCENS